LRSDRQRRAFTLIELLVVIAIIAILAAILVPVCAKARAKARQTSCLSKARQLSTAILSYATDYDEHWPRYRNTPIAGAPDWGLPGDLTTPDCMWSSVCTPYIKNEAIWYCPEAGKTQWGAAAASLGYTYDVALESRYRGAFTYYSLNIALSLETGWCWASCATTLSQAAVRRPVDTMLTQESCWDVTSPMTDWAVGNMMVWPGTLPGSGFSWYIHSGSRLNIMDKNGFSNSSFCDGHAKAVKYDQMEGNTANWDKYWRWCKP